MIERFYLKNHLSFEEVELSLNDGLNLFSGPSGSGKSVLMRSILASFGLENSDAALSEVTIVNQKNSDSVFSDDEFLVFKQLKKEKVRYFINNQSVSKKVISKESSNFLRHLNTKDFSDFNAENLLLMLDEFVIKSDTKHKGDLLEFQRLYKEYKDVVAQLDTILEEQRRIIELKEFASFEIQKIESVNPQIGEDEELQKIKKDLSQKEKIEKKIFDAQAIFNFEHSVNEVLSTLDVESSFFDDAMNELRALFDTTLEKLNDLDDIEVEEVLDRIEALASLKKRHLSIEGALEYLETKKRELAHYESIETTKNDFLEKKMELKKQLDDLAEKISSSRAAVIDSINSKINVYAEDLYLDRLQFAIERIELNSGGVDDVTITYNSTSFKNMSSGEFNRLRLALLALKSEVMESHGGILMLDEIDANLSGEESMSVAKVLKILARRFQILAISHQPQLSSMADSHFLVYKENKQSCVKLLQKKERVNEIARMISAGEITKEALSYASKLLEI